MLDKDTLYRLYVSELRTTTEIGLLVNKTPTTISNWLKKYDIPRRSFEDAQRSVRPTKEKLHDLYVTQELSIDNIARSIGSSESSISKLLDKYGIQKRANTDKFGGWNKGLPLPEKQKQRLSEVASTRTGTNSPRFGVKLTKETRSKIASALKGRFRGKENPQWKGGSAYERAQWHSRHEYKEWRYSVYERDNYTCQLCGQESVGNIQAHHIHPWSTHPELRFEVSNGITLCKPCHLSIKGIEAQHADRFVSILLQSIPQTCDPDQ